MCPSEDDIPLYPGSSFTYNWMETQAGIVQTHPCPQACQDFLPSPQSDLSLMVTRQCVEAAGEGEWENVDFSGCGLSIIVLQLCEASQVRAHL